MTGSVVDHDKFYKKYGVLYDPIEHGTPPDFGGRTIDVPGKGELPLIMKFKLRFRLSASVLICALLASLS